jgi:periplasmic protein TonB
MKRKPLILAMLVVIAHLCHAQAYENEKVIYLDGNGEKTKEKNAVVLEQLIKFDDTLYEINVYRMDGPMSKSFRSIDPDGNTLIGDYRSYDGTGRMDSSGTYRSGKRTGNWAVYANGRFSQKLLYERGNLVWAKDTLQLKLERDSIAAGRKKDSTGQRTVTKVEIESDFPGGAKAWLAYLQKNMHYPDKAVKKRIQGQVVIGFIVDKEGHVPVSTAYVEHSVEYSIDQEALRIIFSSPDWTPAVQNGKVVKSYKKQPIGFRLQ